MYVVLFDCDPFNKKTIIVQVNTIRSAAFDNTTRLEPGDHKFVADPSFINYKWSEIITQATFDGWCEQGNARFFDDKFSEAMFNRIFTGVARSGHKLPHIWTEYHLRLGGKD
jgi:hypothetical protein